MTGTGDAERREDVRPDDGAAPPPPAPPTGWGEPTWPSSGAVGYGRTSWVPEEGQSPGTDPAGEPGTGPTPYGSAPQYGAPQYRAPQYGNPQHGAQQYGAPQYGAPQYGGQQYGAPQYGGQQYGGPFRPPPVQPGIVPLRPLNLTEIYDGAFRAIRVNPRVMFGFSAVVVLVMSVLGGLTQWALIPWVARGVAGTTTDIDPTGQLGLTDSFAASLATVGLVPWLLVGNAVLTGLLTGSVSRSVIGQRVTVAELWHRHWRRTMLLLVLAILQVVALGILIALVLGAITGLAVADQPGLAVAAGLLLVPAGVVVAVWVGVRLLLLPPALVLEGNGVVATVKRAWRLTRGSFWRVLGIYLLASVIVGLVGQVLSVPVSVIAAIAQPDVTSPGFIFLTTLLTGLVQAISTVFLAAVVALLYIDLRIRREGLDVELARAAEVAAGAAGGTGAGRS
ncbi:proline-rich domain-containing protein [Actinotalea sp. Marseille-Q4924]|uniref:proline-rich domain-containing protein n=1 Tax=Actinotalea sp. Marseille-Q4924 TaxID=2866571 RepID=UPI001CE4B419|nr:proline-rich domain-containing protein [Actinotalea sp. Marseille-Q4924]